MPMLIEHIDAIARQKQRDVLYLIFRKPPGEDDGDGWPGELDWENLPIRARIIEWLETKGIGWQPCAGVANLNYMGGSDGMIYIDLPFDQTWPAYRELQEYLEYPDGSIRFPEVFFAYLPLEKAMENAAHDEPGFWEKWAENF